MLLCTLRNSVVVSEKDLSCRIWKVSFHLYSYVHLPSKTVASHKLGLVIKLTLSYMEVLLCCVVMSKNLTLFSRFSFYIWLNFR